MERGEARIDEYLDITTFVRRQRRQLAAFKVIFTKMERYLLQNNKSFVLAGKCESSDEDSDMISDWDEKKGWNEQ